MRIGIDCRTILNPEKGEAAGVGHYNYQLVRHLLRIDKKNQYVLFFDRSVKEKRIDKFRKRNAIIKYFPFSQYSKFLPIIYSQFLVTAAIVNEKVDVFHSPVCYLPKSYKGSAVITLHELAIFKEPEWFSKGQWSDAKVIIPRCLKQAKKIIVASESIKEDVIKMFKIKKDKIEVISHGVDERFFRRRKARDISRIKKKLGISGDYILYLGMLEPRKNILGIIKAFELLKKQGKGREHLFKKYQLVLAGQEGEKIKSALNRIKQSKFKKDIILPGYIDPNDIGPLYEGAKVFVFPSLYEGFGLPILEAMAKGVPVITGNGFSMPEVAGDAALLVNPKKVTEIFSAIAKILTNKKLAKELSKKGVKRARQFTWAKAIKKTLAVYKEAKQNER